MHYLTHLENIIPLAIAAFFAIVFLQSALDKIFDWKGNLSWLTGHFEKSFLGKMVPLLLGTILLVELAAGIFSAVGFGEFLISGGTSHIALGLAFSMGALLMLLFGQRIAKDYEGAKTISIYFIVALISSIYFAIP